MNEPHFVIMPLDEGYAAISNMHGHFSSPTLVGFGARLHEEMRVKFGVESDDVEFTPSELLTPNLVICATCNGATRVETDGVAWQFLRDESGIFDWAKKATRVCQACAGLGFEIPGFWQTAPSPP